jgi:hypothetical protein
VRARARARRVRSVLADRKEILSPRSAKQSASERPKHVAAGLVALRCWMIVVVKGSMLMTVVPTPMMTLAGSLAPCVARPRPSLPLRAGACDRPSERLGRIRMVEEERAWQAVGRVPDRHDWLGHPDGGVADVPFEELVDAIAAVMEQERPTVVPTFGPDGIFGHPDHIAIGAATDAAFMRVRRH